jgi:hypothetical protein
MCALASQITVVTDSGESCGFDGKVRLRMHCECLVTEMFEGSL